MEVKYNVTGLERKALVEAIAKITEEDFQYQGVPSCAYQIGPSFQVNRVGTLIIDDLTDNDIVEDLLEALGAKGFEFEAPDAPQVETSEDDTTAPQEATVTEPRVETNRLDIEMKLEGIDEKVLQNLNRIIESKGSLIRRSLDTDNLEYKLTDSSITFPWFTLDGCEGEADAYTRFIVALIQMAKESKRITAKPKEVENEKFAFRVFLIRLGFVGDEYKMARKLLLKRLTGNSAFKGGARNVSE